MIILMTNVGEIVNNLPMSKNIDPKWLKDFINIAQLIHIKPILGIDLFNDILTNILANTLSPDYIILLNNYIKIPLAYWVVYENLPFLNNRIEAKGVMRNADDTSSAVDTKTIVYLRSELSNKAEVYDKLMFDFLEANQSLYPLYKSTTNCATNNFKYFSNIGFY